MAKTYQLSMPFVRVPLNQKAARSRDSAADGPGFVLGVRVVMMVVAMMVTAGGKSRSGKHHQKQGGGKNLFHATNVAWTRQQEKCFQHTVSRELLGRRSPQRGGPESA
jgi:hypothetical protein